MKILTIVGTRPEIIRLSLIIKKLDEFAEKQILVHTGQNFTDSLSDIFFRQMKVRQPDYFLLKSQKSLGEQLSVMYGELEKILIKEKPDKVLILGDTNSGLLAVLSERMGIPVFHMEAGNRCFDLEVPEEKNRRVIDAISSINLPYTPGSRENLLREGLPSNKIIMCGNPILEVIHHYQEEISGSSILETMKLNKEDYLLVTTHRAENVDHPARLLEIMKGLNLTAKAFQKRIICSVHPRTRSKLEHLALEIDPLIEFHEPFGFFDFIKLEQNAYCVLTDSGTVQEECCLFHVPAVTVRKTTERPETIQCGSNMLSGLHAEAILDCVKIMTAGSRDWAFPEGYNQLDVSEKVIKILLGGITVVN
ncbi:UDP-N-acetylglucosamine 2-epimerase (non-hydrolyzing) [Metabacillus sp. GX 13764]|uniref:non-hydrolyzing UDP-N-acetylglucosamine 2-epimerase n=1 Tax=Metabacillus kandeliae TaxID=2900151 RepID=UPI001E5B4887|nr:UDP-N-acetylglucosamine 2-epimerase (non-hydrolyzing) [Metabacillus kandeliae]MCD7032634.1 UDP-N-acetylglucosamine 2-epimerase (non-hydrolyzing) [Metabacillus kandeliae]